MEKFQLFLAFCCYNFMYAIKIRGFLWYMCIFFVQVGLAVGDIDTIQQSATLKRLAMQVEFVAEIEQSYPRFVTRRLYHPTVILRPNRSSRLRRYEQSHEQSRTLRQIEKRLRLILEKFKFFSSNPRETLTLNYPITTISAQLTWSYGLCVWHWQWHLFDFHHQV